MGERNTCFGAKRWIIAMVSWNNCQHIHKSNGYIFSAYNALFELIPIHKGEEILNVLYYEFDGVTKYKSVRRYENNVKAPNEDAWELFKREENENMHLVQKLFTGVEGKVPEYDDNLADVENGDRMNPVDIAIDSVQNGGGELKQDGEDDDGKKKKKKKKKDKKQKKKKKSKKKKGDDEDDEDDDDDGENDGKKKKKKKDKKKKKGKKVRFADEENQEGDGDDDGGKKRKKKKDKKKKKSKR